MVNPALGMAAALISNIMLCGVYLYVYLTYGGCGVARWAIGWALYAARGLVVLLLELGVVAAGASAAAELLNLASAGFLFAGTSCMAGRRLSARFGILVAVAALWIVGADRSGASFAAVTFIPSAVMAGTLLVLAVRLRRGYAANGFGAVVAAVTLVLWAVHKLNYPFLGQNSPFMPYGFLIGGGLALSAALGMLMTYLDLTRAQMRARENRFSAVVDSMEDMVLTASFDAYVTAVYGGWFARNGSSERDLVGSRLTALLGHRRDATIMRELACVAAGEIRHLTLDLELAEGTRWFAFTASPLLDAHESIAGAVIIGRDITELVTSRDELSERLNENRTLLQEVHHRVKNNMQVMSSLLALQSARLADQNDRLLIEESSRRIETMAHVHEQLYASRSLTHVAMAPYIAELGERLAHAYSNPYRQLTVRTSVEDISLSIERAVPCAQILHELVSNSLKHAFAGQDRGTVTVSLRRNESNRFVLTVSDDGCGMAPPENADRPESLGLQLVELLSRQLDGEYAFVNHVGTTFTLAFPGERCHA